MFVLQHSSWSCYCQCALNSMQAMTADVYCVCSCSGRLMGAMQLTSGALSRVSSCTATCGSASCRPTCWAWLSRTRRYVRSTSAPDAATGRTTWAPFPAAAGVLHTKSQQ